MLENKKKIAITLIIAIITVIGGIIYYFTQNNDEEYYNFEEGILEENIDNSNDIINSPTNEIEKTRQIVVHIAGQVTNPGVISLNEGARIIDAINAAGGTTKDADLSKINLAYVLEDAQKIYIPSVNEKEGENYIEEGRGQEADVTSGSSEAKITTSQKIMININTANETELQKIPGIGQSIASKIVTYRKENGKFSTIEDIQKVSGIGSSKYNNIKKYICVK